MVATKQGNTGVRKLGQLQNTEGGDFNIYNAFAGEIYQLNIFDRPLTDDDIETIFRNGRCSYLDHSLLEDVVVSWEDM